MKKNIVGIIVEYNPFHNGHKYHLEKAKEKGEIVVAVMSGDFVQRGEPAIVNRWERAKMALKAGVDLVVELPIFYSTQSAEIFALGAIKILEKLKVNEIVFGTEEGSLGKIKKILEIEKKEGFNENLKSFLKEGISYPNAYIKTLKLYGIEEELQSNEILALEYKRAIEKIGSKIEVTSIKRENSTYYSEEVKGNISSATGIRKKIFNSETVESLMPKKIYNILKNNSYTSLKEYYELIRVLVLQTKDNLNRIQDIEDGYENRVYESVKSSRDFDEFMKNVVTKRYTIGRVQRILLHILLGITKEITEKVKIDLPFIRVLAFNEKGKEHLKFLKKEGVKVLVGLKNIKKDLNEFEKNMLELNENASIIYSMKNFYENEKVAIIEVNND